MKKIIVLGLMIVSSLYCPPRRGASDEQGAGIVAGRDREEEEHERKLQQEQSERDRLHAPILVHDSSIPHKEVVFSWHSSGDAPISVHDSSIPHKEVVSSWQNEGAERLKHKVFDDSSNFTLPELLKTGTTVPILKKSVWGRFFEKYISHDYSYRLEVLKAIAVAHPDKISLKDVREKELYSGFSGDYKKKSQAWINEQFKRYSSGKMGTGIITHINKEYQSVFEKLYSAHSESRGRYMKLSSASEKEFSIQYRISAGGYEYIGSKKLTDPTQVSLLRDLFGSDNAYVTTEQFEQLLKGQITVQQLKALSRDQFKEGSGEFKKDSKKGAVQV